MKKRRVFIAINLPQAIKKKLVDFQNKWSYLDVRWIKKENLHITLAFVGCVNEEELLEICQLTQKVAQRHRSFEIRLKRICLGPSNKKPKMIWVEGEKSEPLAKLKSEIGIDNYPIFQPHITLARNLRERPDINQSLDLSFFVDSIEVMESYLARGGSNYVILESAELK